MDKATHQHLRFDLEQDVSRLLDDEHLVRQVLDLVMRRVVQEQAAEAITRAAHQPRLQDVPARPERDAARMGIS
ncbi:hypothetical protein V2193_33810 (plasmid) [Pseudomonas aeruginosa]